MSVGAHERFEPPRIQSFPSRLRVQASWQNRSGQTETAHFGQGICLPIDGCCASLKSPFRQQVQGLGNVVVQGTGLLTGGVGALQTARGLGASLFGRVQDEDLAEISHPFVGRARFRQDEGRSWSALYGQLFRALVEPWTPLALGMGSLR